MITNRTPASRSCDFVITRLISDQIELHSVQLPLLIVSHEDNSTDWLFSFIPMVFFLFVMIVYLFCQLTKIVPSFMNQTFRNFNVTHHGQTMAI